MKKILIFILLFFSCLSIYGQDTLILSRLNFDFNLIEIKKDNDYNNFIEYTLPYIHSNENNIQKIILTGYASPEGNEQHNRELADGRIKSVSSLINIDPSLIVKQSIGENYKDIHSIIGSIYSEEISSIIATSSDPKSDLIKLYNGKVWKELHNIFQDLRYVKIEIILKNIPEKIIQETVKTEYVIDTVYITNCVILRDTVYLKYDKMRRTRPLISIKSNILTDVIPYSPFGISFTPNIQAELYTWFYGTSLEFSYMFPWWSDTYKCYQILNGTAGIRKYFNNKYTGFYIGAYFNTGIYDLMKDKDNGWQGEILGGGISFGYVFQTKFKRFKIEPYIRIGYLSGNFDKYHYGEDSTHRYYYTYTGNNSDFVQRRFHLSYIGPTIVGINLTYDLICVGF